jgi:hypothetical protein
MASNLFGPGNRAERSAQDIQAAQDVARAADARQQRAAAAAGRDRRSIGTTR